MYKKEEKHHELWHGLRDYKYYPMVHKVMKIYHFYTPNFYIMCFDILLKNEGLSYLHHECNMIHGDVRSSSILLSRNLEGKISDFGISRPTINTKDHIATTSVDNTGYSDPT